MNRSPVTPVRRETSGGSCGQMAAQMRYSSLRRLHEIQQPTLVIHGEKDRLVSPLNARRMARRIPGARLRIIAGAGQCTSMIGPGSLATSCSTS